MSKLVSTTTQKALHLTVYHRHGPVACGGAMFIALRRFRPLDVLSTSDFELPSGRVPRDGEVFCCDACGAPIFAGAEEFLTDLQDAGAYPMTEYRDGDRVRYGYLEPLDDDDEADGDVNPT